MGRPARSKGSPKLRRGSAKPPLEAEPPRAPGAAQRRFAQGAGGGKEVARREPAARAVEAARPAALGWTRSGSGPASDGPAPRSSRLASSSAAVTRDGGP